MAYDGDPDGIIWNRSGHGQVLHGQLISGNAFSVAGVGMAMGRAFTPADDQPSDPKPLVILRNGFWKQRLGSDPNIVGKSIMLNGLNYNIIGVAQPGFMGFEVAMAPDFWTPLSMAEKILHDPGRLTSRNSNWLLPYGRLAAGQTTKSAQAEMSVLARELELAHPDTNKDMDEIFTYAPVPGPYRGYVRAFTGMLMAVFGLVLVIACTNAASLLMVKATGRAREMAIRSALGAGRGRLIRQMTVESLLLSLIAGCAALLLASLTSHLLLNLIPTSLPISIELPLDWRVLVFTFVASPHHWNRLRRDPGTEGHARRPGRGDQSRNALRRLSKVAASHRGYDWRGCCLRVVIVHRDPLRAEPAERQFDRPWLRYAKYSDRHTRCKQRRL